MVILINETSPILSQRNTAERVMYVYSTCTVRVHEFICLVCKWSVSLSGMVAIKFVQLLFTTHRNCILWGLAISYRILMDV